MLKKIKIIIDENTSSDFAHFSTMKNDDSMKTNDNGGLEVFDFINAKEIADFLGIGTTKAYEICKKVNAKLEAEGFLTFRGKIPRKAFLEQLPH